MELIAFVETGGKLRDVVVLPLRSPGQPEPANQQELFEAQKAAIAPLHTFEVAHATCHLPSDMDTLLAAIESGFGSHTAFNIKARVRVGVRVRVRVRATLRVRVSAPPSTSRCAARASRSYATCASARSRQP